MKLIDIIPIGKKHKETRENLMKKINIKDARTFREMIKDLRGEYVVLFDDGYYLPASKEEYMEFINKMKNQQKEAEKVISLAYKEMEKKGYDKTE